MKQGIEGAGKGVTSVSDPGISVPNSSSNGAAAKQENVASSKQDSGLFKDKTFQAIYNAFQLGWSLYELKSRILLASFDVELQASQKPGDQQPQGVQQNPLQAFIDDLFSQAQSVNAPPQPADDS